MVNEMDKKANVQGMMSLYNLVRCILLNKNKDAKVHAINDFKRIGEYIKSRMDWVFENETSFNTEFQNLMRESAVIEDEIRMVLPHDKEHLLLKYDEITNSLCDILREEVYLQGVCDGVSMANRFARYGDTGGDELPKNVD